MDEIKRFLLLCAPCQLVHTCQKEILGLELIWSLKYAYKVTHLSIRLPCIQPTDQTSFDHDLVSFGPIPMNFAVLDSHLGCFYIYTFNFPFTAYFPSLFCPFTWPFGPSACVVLGVLACCSCCLFLIMICCCSYYCCCVLLLFLF